MLLRYKKIDPLALIRLNSVSRVFVLAIYILSNLWHSIATIFCNVVNRIDFGSKTSQNLAIVACQILMQPPRTQLQTYRDWSPAWLASWLPFDIAFPSPFPSPPLPSFPSFSFLPRRKLFTRRILVVQDESGGYLLSIDRFWQHAKSFWPSLRGLTSPFIYPSFSLLPFFAPFSYRPHFFFWTVSPLFY